MKNLLVVAGVLLLAAGSSQAALTPWFDSFEDPDGNSNWSHPSGGSFKAVSDVGGHTGSKAMRWDLANGRKVERSFGTPDSPFSIEFYLYHNNNTATRIKHRIMLHAGSGESGDRMMALKLEDHDNGTTFGIGSEDGAGGIGPLDEHVWHKFNIDVRPGDGYDWYVNDTLIGSRASGGGSPQYLILKRNSSGGSVSYIDSINITPEPATLGLLAMGGLGLLRRRTR